MRVQNIFAYTQPKQSFKQVSPYENWDYDYGTYYNNFSIKDAVISASIVSGIMTVAGMLLSNSDKIFKIFGKVKNDVKKLSLLA